jgi:hypothetical protein
LGFTHISKYVVNTYKPRALEHLLTIKSRYLDTYLVVVHPPQLDLLVIRPTQYFQTCHEFDVCNLPLHIRHQEYYGSGNNSKFHNEEEDTKQVL